MIAKAAGGRPGGITAAHFSPHAPDHTFSLPPASSISPPHVRTLRRRALPSLAIVLLGACAGVRAPGATGEAAAGGAMTDGAWQRQATGVSGTCRSLSAVSEQVAWVGCSGGRMLRTRDGGETWSNDSVRGAARLDFRGIKAFDAVTAVIASAGAAEQGAARIYRTTDGGTTWSLAWTDSTKGIFLDGVAFWDARHGFAFSDPVDGRLVVLTTDDGGAHWTRVPPGNIPPVIPGEAAFAASNTQLTVQGSSNAWIATGGGAVARVFRTTDRGRTWAVSATAMPGGPSAGLFGIAFADARNGLAVGGDYNIARGPTDYAIRTSDGGLTWKPTAGRPDGVTQGLTFVPHTSPPVFVATGAHGIALTRDFGASWLAGDTLTSFAVGFVSARVGWVAGPRGRVAKFVPR